MSTGKLVSKLINAILILVNKDQIETFISKFIGEFGSDGISGSWDNNVALSAISLRKLMRVPSLVLNWGPSHIIDVVTNCVDSYSVC